MIIIIISKKLTINDRKYPTKDGLQRLNKKKKNKGTNNILLKKKRR